MSDPYKLLGVSRTATDAQIRAAYRKLVKATHPDHNGGSPEAAQRFEAVQDAYAEIQRQRKTAPPPPEAPAQAVPDSGLEARMADLERQVREARERAQRAAREAMRTTSERKRPTDEELGYLTTDDSLSKILADARTELTERYSHAREHPVVQRVSDLIAGLEDLAGKLDRPPRGK
ncbi:MAG TPA: J domain-containing protein [Solirubrobacteraceae bacterium]|nr:J domain-containing protein [Solirubrobacteraceae bacterium]